MLFELALAANLFAAEDSHLLALKYEDLYLFESFVQKTGIPIMNKELNGLNFSLTIESYYLAEECRNCRLKFLVIKGNASCLFRRSQNASFESVIFEGVTFSDALVIQSFSLLSFHGVSVQNSSISALVYESFNEVSMSDSNISNSSFAFYRKTVPLFSLYGVVIYNSTLLNCPGNGASSVSFSGGKLNLISSTAQNSLKCSDVHLVNTPVWVEFEFVVSKVQNATCLKNKTEGALEGSLYCKSMNGTGAFAENTEELFSFSEIVVGSIKHNARFLCKAEDCSKCEEFVGSSLDWLNCRTCDNQTRVPPEHNDSCYQKTCPGGPGVQEYVPSKNNLALACQCKSLYEGEQCSRCKAGYVRVGADCQLQVVAGGYCYLSGDAIECSSCDPGYRLTNKKCRRLPDNGIYIISVLFGAAGVAAIAVLVWLLIVCCRTRAPRYLAGVSGRPPQLRVGSIM